MEWMKKIVFMGCLCGHSLLTEMSHYVYVNIHCASYIEVTNQMQSVNQLGTL